jgi:DNA-directed RNA polymerase subunit beta'
MAFWPKLVKGTTIRYNPLVSKGYNVDADGDLMSFHVPVSRKAVQEAAERMVPSKNLLNPATLKAYTGVPMEEFAQGLYLASRPPKGKPIKFPSKEAMLQALRQGKITYDTAVEIPD